MHSIDMPDVTQQCNNVSLVSHDDTQPCQATKVMTRRLGLCHTLQRASSGLDRLKESLGERRHAVCKACLRSTHHSGMESNPSAGSLCRRLWAPLTTHCCSGSINCVLPSVAPAAFEWQVETSSHGCTGATVSVLQILQAQRVPRHQTSQ